MTTFAAGGPLRATEHELAVVRLFSGAGLSDSAISRILGCRTPNAVAKIRRRRGWPAGNPRPRIVHTYVAPAGVDESDVLRLMQGDRTIPAYQRGPGVVGRHLTPEIVEAVARLARAGLTDDRISARLHGILSQDAVLKVRSRRGIATGGVR